MGRGQGERRVGRRSVTLVDRSSSPLSSSRSLSCFALVIALFAPRTLILGDGRRPGRALSWAKCRTCRSLIVAVVDCSSSCSSITRRRARRLLVVALVNRSSSRYSIARRRAIRRASRCALRAKGIDCGRWAAAGESVEFGRGGRRASTVVW